MLKYLNRCDLDLPEYKSMSQLPDQVDLLVIGSGAAGMTAALAASLEGLDVLLVEKRHVLGGTSALSAGSIWLPNTHHNSDSSFGEDSYDKALTYLRAAVGNRLDQSRVSAFLQKAPEMTLRLEREAGLCLRAYPHHPDYLATLDGATLAGRVLEPVPFDAAVLGNRFADLAPPLPEFTLLGGMMVDRADIGHLLNAAKRPGSFIHSARLLARYTLDRIRHQRGRRLVMGNALVGRLYHALLASGVKVAMQVTTSSLIVEHGHVSGAELQQSGRSQTVSARSGVVLATGGYSHCPELRALLCPEYLSDVSAVAAGATGDGLALAKPCGGQLSSNHESGSFWAPVSHRQREDGSTAVFPHFVLDRGKPGAFAVGPDGNRFVNEATTYHLFGEALFEMKSKTNGGACYLICNHDFIQRYGLGIVRPKGIGLKSALRDGYIIRAASLHELANRISVPASSLAASAERHAAFSVTGVDEDFAKGEDAYQRNLGDPLHRPNPCLGELGGPPFYALELHPGDIGASAGLVCDASARVLSEDGEPIPGLYACGADVESIMAGRYPGPGITLGPAMTFAYIAATHAAARVP